METRGEFIAHLRDAAAARSPGAAVSDSAYRALGELATVQPLDGGHVMTRQFAPASSLFFIARGAVRWQIRLEEGNEDLEVGRAGTPWTPVGWSGFRLPRRYATTVVCIGPCEVVRFAHDALRELFARHPSLGCVVVERIIAHGLTQLTDLRSRLAQASRTPVNVARALRADGEEEAYRRAPPSVDDALRRSPFFEAFDERDLRRFAGAMESRDYCRGEPIVAQGERAPGVWLLATGRVALNFRPASLDAAAAIRTLEPGAVVAFAGVGGVPTHAASVMAVRDCTLYRLVPERLEPVLDRHPDLALRLVVRLLWLIANHLRSARALFISRRFEQEKLAIRNMLEQSCTQLSVHSPLHRLPHLLESQLTIGDAFRLLATMADSADALERHLAQLCLDLLGEVRREHDFFEALRRVYHAVVSAPPAMPAVEVRKLCARGFQEAFRLTRYVVEGEDHLPDSTGNIFIFNHLKNHEHNTLPNNFQLTLDSHFVSAMILDRRYGDSGIRVVRQSRGTEYGHQDYYDRLGHLSVYTAESDQLEETDAERRVRREEFFQAAGRCLRAGTNLILSPEGTSYWTEDSPGPFKAGAFRLAASVTPEPWIVPLAVAHFDRRVHSTVCAAVIKPPFRISDVLRDPRDRRALAAFLDDFRETYRGYVDEARRLAARASSRSSGPSGPAV